MLRVTVITSYIQRGFGKITKIAKKNKLWVYIISAITVTATLTTLVINVIDLNTNYLIFKRNRVEPQLYLSPNNPPSKIIELMGEPLSIETKENGVESIYFLDDLWIKQIVAPDGNPIALSFNSCDKKRVDLPIGAIWKNNKQHVFLNKTPMEAIANAVDPINADDRSVSLYYMVGANYLYFVEQYGGGNPTNYQVYYWGFTDLCNMDGKAYDYLRDNVKKLSYKGSLLEAPSEVRTFRTLLKPNFIGQTAVYGTSINNLEKLLQEIGISKLIPRTLPQHSYD